MTPLLRTQDGTTYDVLPDGCVEIGCFDGSRIRIRAEDVDVALEFLRAARQAIMRETTMITTTSEYVDRVQRGDYPQQPRVPQDHAFVDARGEIRNVLLMPIASVARITSRRGSVRANHYHLTDSHFALVESGRVLYFERAIDSTEIPEPTEFVAGDMFYTPPNREHAMLFAEDSVIFTYAQNVRSHDNHEADLVRVSFVTPEVIRRYL